MPLSRFDLGAMLFRPLSSVFTETFLAVSEGCCFRNRFHFVPVTKASNAPFTLQVKPV